MFGSPTSSPHLHGPADVGRVMRQVIYALLPAITAYTWMFGWGVPINLVLACATALASEAAVLILRRRPVAPALADGSALLTAILLAIALPPLTPWWVTVVGTAFAIVMAKQLYGGLGYNPFNPAMVGYVLLLISFPLEMTTWLAPAAIRDFGLDTALGYVFAGIPPHGQALDTITMATPLDSIKTLLGVGKTVSEIRQEHPLFSILGGQGWAMLNLLFLLGGLWLMVRRVITWHVPAGMLGALFIIALVFNLAAPERYPGPLFHVFSGASLLGAFFIATDPVSGSTTPRGRVLFGVGTGLLTYVIRTWGGYPDGVAFSVLIMNMVAPTLDYYTRPRAFGHDRG